MKKKRSKAAAVILAAGVSAVLAFTSSAKAVTTTQLQIAASGSQANIASNLRVTPDGRYAAFESLNTSLVSGDTNGKQDIFVKNMATGTINRVSVDSSGNEANDESSYPVITNNGRYVLFLSRASNLATITGVPAGKSYTSGVYLHDMVSGATSLIASGYDNGNGFKYVTPGALSEDARFVYFMQMLPGDLNRVMLLDRDSGDITDISTDNSGTPPTSGYSDSVSTSCDGRFAVFQSNASTLVSGDTNGKYDVFMADSMNGHKITKVSLGATGSNGAYNPTISCDGNSVLYNSDLSDVISGDTNGLPDAFVYHVASGITERVSVSTSGSQLSAETGATQLSANGRVVLFSEYETHGGVSHWQTYARNLATDTTSLVSQDGSGNPANGDTMATAISDDGTQAVMSTLASNLGFSNPNPDIYYIKATSLGI